MTAAARARLGLALWCVALAACADAPEPAAAFEGQPVRTETLEGDVEIEVRRTGAGPTANAADRVEIHYLVYLEDGEQVDGSHDGKPRSFLVLEDSELIEGLQRGVLGMQVGELRRVWVPPRLGYGDRRVGKIPPKARLRFDVELMALHPNPYRSGASGR